MSASLHECVRVSVCEHVSLHMFECVSECVCVRV